jgi:hypothetical protein
MTEGKMERKKDRKKDRKKEDHCPETGLHQIFCPTPPRTLETQNFALLLAPRIMGGMFMSDQCVRPTM